MIFFHFKNFFQKDEFFGLDISDISLKTLMLMEQGGKIALRGFGYTGLEEGIMSDGIILDAERLREKIKNLVRETKPAAIKARNIIVSLPESKVFIDIFRVPYGLKGINLEKNIKDHIAATFPFELENLYYDYMPISNSVKAKEREFFCAACPSEIIGAYQKIFKEVNLEAKVFEMESCSVARALVGRDQKDQTFLIIDMGARTTNLSIYDGQHIRFSATVKIAGSHFTKIIAENLKISFDEAEKLKIASGIEGDSKNQSPPSSLLKKSLLPLIEEIKTIGAYYEKEHQKKIDLVILCGGSSLISGLESYFAKEFTWKIESIDPWGKIGIAKITKDDKMLINEHPLLYTNVIGLALRALEDSPVKAGINLLNHKGH